MCIEKKLEQFISLELKKIFRVSSRTLLIGLTVGGKCAWQEEEEIKRYSRTVLMLQEQLFVSELFRDSIISSGLIPGGQNLSKTQTVFFLSVDPMDKSHKDPDVIYLSVPLHAQYLHKAWNTHQDAVYWVDINLTIKKGLTFYQTRSNAIILRETLPAYCVPKVVRMETEGILYEKVYMSPRPPPKISLKHEWKRDLGSEHAQRSEVGQLSRSFQSNQPILNPIRERTGRPVIRDNTRTLQDERKTSRSQEIDVNSFHEELVSSERTGRPVIETSVIQARSSEDNKDPNVEKADERTKRLVSATNTENVPDSSRTRSVHESETFNVGDKTLRIMTISVMRK